MSSAARRGTGVSSACTGCSPSRTSATTARATPSCWEPRHSASTSASTTTQPVTGIAFDPCVTGLDHVCFSVTSRTELDNWTAHLDRCGVLHSGITEFEMGGMHFAVLNSRDPDDIALELMAVS